MNSPGRSPGKRKNVNAILQGLNLWVINCVTWKFFELMPGDKRTSERGLPDGQAGIRLGIISSKMPGIRKR